MEFKELSPVDYWKVRTLLQAFDYSLSVRAVLEGNNPGKIFVDDPAQPRTVFALTVEGYLLTGEHDNQATLEALRGFLEEKIFTGQVFINGDESLSLAVHPQKWECRLPDLIPTHEAEKVNRYHYLCRQLAFDWRSNLPVGYTVQRIDKAMLNDPNILFPEEVGDWNEITDYWESVEDFLSKGAGFCVLDRNLVVSKCTSDCVAGEQIDIGIVTDPAHRRRGLAAVAVAATVEHCFQRGFKQIGWHCNAENIGSWKVAEKVGFKRNCEYAYYYYMYDLIDHLAELGWYNFRHGDYARTADYYERVFSQRDKNPDYYYHLAAVAWANLGNKEKAFRYLNAAADNGWAEVEWTKRQNGFLFLHDFPEWEAVIARMEKNAM